MFIIENKKFVYLYHMNLVKTYIDRSPIEGIGLFAAEFIPKGTLIWEIGDIDRIMSRDEFLSLEESLPQVARDYLLRYSYDDEDGVVILCGDDAKYTNHSYVANTDGEYALQDIHVGEEITCDYRKLCGEEWTEQEFEVLKSYRPDEN